MMQTLELRERDDDDVRIARGHRIGRYLVLSEIGRGGMGIVYRAYDPELNRKVALKVLRTAERDRERLAVARVRLQREAQTLARLSHRNVVCVYDVGTRGDTVFLAMELCEGEDLQRWLARRPRTPAEVVEVMLRAGEGLAAAHEVGIVHRDFKPSNVLVGHDGRVCVTDFGLARPEPTVEMASRAHASRVGATTDATDSAMGDGSLFDLTLTRDGRAVGTPAYMAPEQHAGEPADPRSDQFSFCIALWEALYGRRPFLGVSSQVLAEHKRLGLDAAPSARGVGGRVPRRIRRALVRGLARHSSRRFAGLRDLLAALRPPPPRVLRVAPLALVATASALASTWGPLRAVHEGPCTGSHARIAGVWNEGQRTAVVTAFTNTDVAYARATATAVVDMLDRRSDAWAAMHEDTCAATWVRGEQSQHVLDLRMSCLEEQRRHLAATVEILVDADRGVVDHAASMVAVLPDLSACADPARLEREPALPDPGISDRVALARDTLAHATAARRAGRHREALELVGQLERDTRGLPHEATLADIAILHARIIDDDGRPDEAIKRLEAAAVFARRSAHVRAEASAWTELARIVGGRMQDTERGRFYGELALAAIATLGHDDELVAAARLELGEVEFRSGNDTAASEHIHAALELREARLGPEHYLVAETLAHLAGIHFRAGDHVRATDALTRAIAIYVDVFGREHPRVAAPMGNLGLVLAASGRTEDALAQMASAREILQAAFGPNHPGVAAAHDSIGHVLLQAGRLDDAVPSFRAAITTFERTLGAEHPAIAAPLLGLASSLLARDEPEPARAALEHARRAAEGGELPPVECADIDFALARALHATGEPVRALELARSARATYVEALDPADDRFAAIDAWLRAHGVPPRPLLTRGRTAPVIAQ